MIKLIVYKMFHVVIFHLLKVTGVNAIKFIVYDMFMWSFFI